jgi:hypothetical protein
LSEVKDQNLDEASDGMRMVLRRADNKLGEVKTFANGLGVMARWMGQKERWRERSGQGRRNEQSNLRVVGN